MRQYAHPKSIGLLLKTKECLVDLSIVNHGLGSLLHLILHIVLLIILIVIIESIVSNALLGHIYLVVMVNLLLFVVLWLRNFNVFGILPVRAFMGVLKDVLTLLEHLVQVRNSKRLGHVEYPSVLNLSGFCTQLNVLFWFWCTLASFLASSALLGFTLLNVIAIDGVDLIWINDLLPLLYGRSPNDVSLGFVIICLSVLRLALRGLSLSWSLFHLLTLNLQIVGIIRVFYLLVTPALYLG